MPPLIWVSALLLFVTAAPDEERGRPPPASLAVVPILRAPAERAGLVSGASRATLARLIEGQAERHVEIRVQRAEELFVADASDLNRKLLDCGADAGCLAGRLERLGARLGLIASVNYFARPPFLDVRLVDTETGRTGSSMPGPLLEEEGTVEVALTRRTQSVLESEGHPLAATLVVETVPPDAAIELSCQGRSRRSSSGTTEKLRPGPWAILATHEGFEPQRRDLTLVGGQAEKLTLSLVETPSSFPWILAGAAVGLIAAGVITYVIVSDPGCICVGPEGLPCEC
ncbi:MAG: hypothetical protein HY791_34505 [Deltaproteobacteria bacterium]|nr:hypothetical protein [Deltaproteobacteria bacterium]